ncbi:MAG: hypothetical protein JWP29_405 [Rhodoferax sp.]|nr:hypothetical protein [Rhodoferax sp.]
MDALNLTLFGLIAAGPSPHPFWLAVATLIAQKSAWLCVAVFAWAAWRHPSQRWHVLAALVAAGVASVVSRNLAEGLGLPRPFMVNLSPSYIEHGARGALPSTHATVMFTMAFLFMLRPLLRRPGWLLLAVAAITGWARIYLGVHFPRDIAAGMVVGALLALTFDATLARLGRMAWTPATPAQGRRPGTRLAPVLSLMDGAHFSLYFTLLFTAAAIGIGLLAPDVFPLALFRDGGPVENGTIFFYLVAVLMVATLRLPMVSLTDRCATAIVLLACAAREAGWQSWLFGRLPLDTLRHAGGAIVSSLAIAFGVAALMAAAVWLVRRYGQSRHVALAQRQWQPAVTTVLVLVLLSLVTNVLSGMSDALPLPGQAGPRTGLGQLMLSIEELLELAAPLLVMLAFFQARRGHLQPLRDGAAAATQAKPLA